MANDKNLKTSRQFLNEYLNNRNLAVLDNILAPDYRNSMVPAGAPQGKEGEKMIFHAFHTAFPDFRMEPKTTVADGDTVVQQWHFSGTNTGAFNGIPASGKKVQMEGVNILRFRDGQIVSNESYFDQLGLLQQIGGVPAR